MDSQRANTNNALENFEKGIDRQHVFVFRTDAGKLGLMRIVAAGIQTSNGFNYYDLDIKIQK